MNLIELMLQTRMAFIGGKLGHTTLIELGVVEVGGPFFWLRANSFVVLVERMARSNSDASNRVG